MEHQKLKPSLPARLHPTDRCAPLVGNAALHGSTHGRARNRFRNVDARFVFSSVSNTDIGSVPNAFARTTRQRSGDKEAGMRERGCEREREREVVQRENEKGRRGRTE